MQNIFCNICKVFTIRQYKIKINTHRVWDSFNDYTGKINSYVQAWGTGSLYRAL